MRHAVWFVVCLGWLGGSLSAREPETSLVVSRIAFGSCCKQDQPMPIWTAIQATRPDLFLMIGDNIYGDSDDVEVLKRKWATLDAVPEFQQVRRSCRFLATWDDHDYGRNDAGVEYPVKAASQQAFLDFLGEPADAPRRRQAGVHAGYLFGPAGQRVQVLLLDTRYHRSPLKKHGVKRQAGVPYYGPYAPNTDADVTVLGAEQWAWLEAQLRVPADVRIVASSIQILPDGHHWEKWGNYPAERDRLFRLIRETRANGVILISGDRHHAEISRNDTVVGYPLFDVTSSSLNAPGSATTEPNPDRQGDVYPAVNFGLITLDWSAQPPTVALEVRGETGTVLRTAQVPLTVLTPADSPQPRENSR